MRQKSCHLDEMHGTWLHKRRNVCRLPNFINDFVDKEQKNILLESLLCISKDGGLIKVFHLQ